MKYILFTCGALSLYPQTTWLL